MHRNRPISPKFATLLFFGRNAVNESTKKKKKNNFPAMHPILAQRAERRGR